MTNLPARGFGQASNHMASATPRKAPMANVPPMGHALPAAPRPATSNIVKQAPLGTRLAPNMNKTTLPHTDRQRSVTVAKGGPNISNPGGMQGYPSAPSA